jgi:hypothetical protein
MLIQLTRRQPGALDPAGTPVLVNSDLIVSVDPVGEAGCVVEMQGGKKVEVLELYDEVMDRQDDAHDAGVRQKHADERKKARHEKQEAKKKLLASNEAARARDAAAQAHAASHKHQQEALKAAQVAKQAALEAGVPYTEHVTPEGIDLKHPAPQPHQAAPVGTAPPVPPDAAEKAEKADEAKKDADRTRADDRGRGTAFPHRADKK